MQQPEKHALDDSPIGRLLLKITIPSFFGMFVIPLVLILPNYWQLDGVWPAMPITDCLAFVLMILLFVPQVYLSRNKMRESGAAR